MGKRPDPQVTNVGAKIAISRWLATTNHGLL